MIVALAVQLFFPKTLILMLATFNLIICYKEKEWDIEQLVGSGGMPSSHSATVTALAATVGFLDGIGGTKFAIAIILAFIV